MKAFFITDDCDKRAFHFIDVTKISGFDLFVSSTLTFKRLLQSFLHSLNTRNGKLHKQE